MNKIKTMLRDLRYFFLPLGLGAFLTLLYALGDASGICSFNILSISTCFGDDALGNAVFTGFLLSVIAAPFYAVFLLIVMVVYCAIRMRKREAA